MNQAADSSSADAASIRRRHLRVGWWAILGFLTLGITLEFMHGFKVSWFLDEANETRRLMFRLAHAHGVLLGLLNVAFAATLHAAPELGSSLRRIASPCLGAATVLLPGGFLLGGLVVYGGDPGPGVLAVPVGAALLFVGVLIVARATSRPGPGGE